MMKEIFKNQRAHENCVFCTINATVCVKLQGNYSELSFFCAKGQVLIVVRRIFGLVEK